MISSHFSAVKGLRSFAERANIAKALQKAFARNINDLWKKGVDDEQFVREFSFPWGYVPVFHIPGIDYNVCELRHKYQRLPIPRLPVTAYSNSIKLRPEPGT